MAETRFFHLVHPMARTRAIEAIIAAPEGFDAIVGPETRTRAQNRLMWPHLEALSKTEYEGRFIAPTDWKNLAMGAVNSMDWEGPKDQLWVPTLDGNSMMPLGLSTSELKKPTFSKLIEVLKATCAQQGAVTRREAA